MPSIQDEFPSKYLKASDFEDHPTATISHIVREEVGMKKERKPILFFAEYEKGMVMNKTNANNIARLYGDDYDLWTGKKVVLGTQWVDFQGETVNSIRVWPPAKQAGQQQPQAATRMGVKALPQRDDSASDDRDLDLTSTERTERARPIQRQVTQRDERNPPPLDDEIPF